jgi:predicted nucleic acid-binding protein
VTYVADTSVVLPALADGGAAGDAARAALEVTPDVLLAPALLDTEVAQALRGRVRGGKMGAGSAAGALADLASLPIQRCDAVPLLARIWELRDNLTAYDATYVALAELLGAVLITADSRIVKSSRPRCEFRHVRCAG